MIRNLLAVLILCAAASGSVTVHAVLTDGTGTVSKTAFLRFQLENCGANIPSARVPGKAAIQTNFDLRPNQVDGSILYTTLFGNDEIQCGGVFSTYWFVTVMKDQTHPLRDGLSYVLLSGTTFDPAVTPVMSVQQPAPAPPPLCCVSPLQGGSPGGNPGGGPVTFQLPCPTNVVVGANGYSTGNGGFNCDPFFIDDGVGNWTSQSGRTVGPVNGFLGLIGGSASPGSAVKYKLGLNEFRFLARTGTSEYVVPPATLCGTSQVWGVLSTITDGNGDSVQFMQCQNSGTGVDAQTNGVDNANCIAGVCPLLDLVAGTNITLLNTGGGHVRITGAAGGVEAQTNGVDNANCVAAVCPLTNLTNSAATFDGYQVTVSNPSGGIQTHTVVTPNSQISTPSAPILANNNAAGARSITYLIQVCEDGSTCAKHTLTSATATIANANASPQVLMTAYADTLFGGRCADVYVTADSGARTGVPGRIANCVGKAYIDTGTNANGVAATNTNTTVLIPTMNPTSGGCNYPSGSPQGVDGLPCSPNASDDEFTELNPTVAGSNDGKWTWVNQSSATATLTGGTIVLASAGHAGTNTISCIVQVAPTAPYTFIARQWVNADKAATYELGIGFFESGTNKALFTSHYGDGANVNRLVITRWTSGTGVSNLVNTGNGTMPMQDLIFKIQNDGTNLNISSSTDGINYIQQYTELKTASFTTAPDRVGLCINATTGASAGTYDYWRRIQ